MGLSDHGSITQWLGSWADTAHQEHEVGVFIKASKIGEQRVRWVVTQESQTGRRQVLGSSHEASRFVSKAEADTVAQAMAVGFPQWAFHLFETTLADPTHPWTGG